MSNAEVDICNLALSYIGDEATVTSVFPPEGSVQARMCALAYPYALKSLLEESDWNFASAQVRLSPLDTEDTEGWRYAYALPSDCLRVRSVRLQAASAPSKPEVVGYAPVLAGTNDIDYAIGFSKDVAANVVFANEPYVLVRYTRDLKNTDYMPTLFKIAPSYRVASMIVGKRIGGAEGVRYSQYLKNELKEAIHRARAADANQRSGLRQGFNTILGSR